MSNSGRAVTGYMRPGTNRQGTSSGRGALSTALRGMQPGTAKPMTSGGRMLRIGTASML